MDAFKIKRTALRTTFTKLFNGLEGRIQDESVDIHGDFDLLAKFDILREKAVELAKLDNEILNLLVSVPDTELDIIEKEMETADDYTSRFKKLDLLLQGRMNIVKGEDGSVLGNTKRKFKLPIIELNKFGGDIKDWLNFWGQFRQIDEDPDIAESDKFQYLLQATLPKTRAREVVESFPPIGSNYGKAIDSLKSRFGREDLLVEFYVRELLKLTLTMNSGDKKVSLSTLYDKLETQLRALETLNVTTENYAAMLFPLVESCLSEEVLRAWQRSVNFNGKDGLTRLQNLMSFLKSEVENEERISMAIKGFTNKGVTKGNKFGGAQGNKPLVPTAAGLVDVPNGIPCLFCTGKHQSTVCVKAQKMTLNEKRDILGRKRCCFYCLKMGHIGRKCRVSVLCEACGGRHVTIMCVKNVDASGKGDSVPVVENNLSAINSSPSQVYLQTLMVTIKGDTECNIRVLMDPGSQRSYIRKNIALDMRYESIGEETLTHGLFGGQLTAPREHLVYKVRLRNLDNTYACNFEALDEVNICANIPALQPGPWLSELKDKNIPISLDREGPIEVLIGADIYGKLLTGRREILKCGLVAIETALGWIVTGKIRGQDEPTSEVVYSMLVQSDDISKLWEMDILGIQDPCQKRGVKERELAVQDFFENTIRVDDENRYEVQIPWKEGHVPLQRNFDLAKRRLDNILHKLRQNESMDQYDAVFREWLKEGIIEEVPVTEWDQGHYLPHRPVFKENSTTAVRPVFDASSHEKGAPSLNQCVDTGINLIELIPSMLLRFRLEQIGVVADVRKAFLQIGLHEEDRDFVRFLWVDSDGELKIFRHRRVVFGLSCSPYLLGAVISFHLDMYLKSENVMPYSREVITQLSKSFYMDNCVTSVKDMRTLHCFMREATSIFAEAKLDLRGWEYTDCDLPDCSVTSVLGLHWNRKDDTLALSPWKAGEIELVTQRVILSIAQRVYDPLGLTCPVTLVPKILLQRCWSLKGGWDVEVPESIKNEFLAWMDELCILEEIKVPRWVYGVSDVVLNCSIHTFCDASKSAYAAAVFIRVEYSSFVNVQLIQAKSRVAPLKEMTIPRLELMAATVGARLADSVARDLKSEGLHFVYWSDSTTVLAWIRREDHWGVFVWNRVNEIRKLTEKNSWRHVPGQVNPADLPSRGCSPGKLLESKWWEGPSFLKMSPEDWPSSEPEIDEEIVILEKRKGVVSSLLVESVSSNWYYSFSGDYERIVRVMAWISRFLHNCRHVVSRRTGALNCEEILGAEKILVRLIQQETFEGIKDKRLISLRPFLDDEQIVRLRTKVMEREDSLDFRLPAVLPSKHPIVEKLVLSMHRRNCHVGVQGLLCILREKYWLLRGRQTVRAILGKCVICRRHSAKPLAVDAPPLPVTRVREAAAFEVTGVDLAGPLFLKDRKKVWICLFTCAVYRAVHLELVSSLSADSFIQAFRRFVSRRGRPAIVYSDNGTNFVGTNNLFHHLDWDRIGSYSTAERINWKFSPPSSPWWGGWWERLIRLLKQLLRKVLGKSSLNYEDLETVVCDCESVMNSRPLTYMSENGLDLVPLTPNMFLLDLKEVGVPDCDDVDSRGLSKRTRNRQRIRDHLRRRFRGEYLGLLKLEAERSTRTLQTGEVVLVEAENKKRADWPLALVMETIPGRDGKIRLVKLKTSSGVLLRPVQKVYPLEVRDESCDRGEPDPGPSKEKLDGTAKPNGGQSSTQEPQSKSQSEHIRYTKSGRVVRAPKRLMF